jgi:Flp pilus assembly secretin CpaC
VKPRLSKNNKVSLEIETTIEDILPGSGTSADRPTTTKRSVKTNAIINHAETIILGGLIKSADGNSVTKVPILGDIPIIGRLFTSRGDSNSKVNVVIYITPYIIKKSSDLTTLRVRLAELEAVQQQYNKILLDQLEEKTGDREDNRHETFSATSNGKMASAKSYVPVIEKTKVQAVPTTSAVYVPTPAVNNVQYETSTPVQYEEIETPTLDYNQESSYIRSESIMDTFDKKSNVDLNNLNTGIEYNEATTFSQPTERF